MRTILKTAVLLAAGIGIGHGVFVIYLAIPSPPPVNHIEDRREVWNWMRDGKTQPLPLPEPWGFQARWPDQ